MTITNASVDWVTMTTSEDKVGYIWYGLYTKYRAQKQRQADIEKPFSNGYYTGLKIASMQWGYEKHLGYILIISGGDAEKLWQHLKPSDARVTRLDLCVDFVKPDVSYLAKDLYEGTTAERKREQPKLSLYLGPDGGDTLYLGSRHSQQFGRLYDKGVESSTAAPGRYWRAEVEYKKPLSGLMATELAEESSDERVGAISDTVINWFLDRGIRLMEDWESRPGMTISVEQRVTTADRKLAWLKSQVSPTVRQLISLGLGKEVMKSLLIEEDMLLQLLATEN